MNKINPHEREKKCESCKEIKKLIEFRKPYILNNCLLCHNRVKIFKEHNRKNISKY